MTFDFSGALKRGLARGKALFNSSSRTLDEAHNYILSLSDAFTGPEAAKAAVEKFGITRAEAERIVDDLETRGYEFQNEKAPEKDPLKDTSGLERGNGLFNASENLYIFSEGKNKVRISASSLEKAWTKLSQETGVPASKVKSKFEYKEMRNSSFDAAVVAALDALGHPQPPIKVAAVLAKFMDEVAAPASGWTAADVARELVKRQLVNALGMGFEDRMDGKEMNLALRMAQEGRSDEEIAKKLMKRVATIKHFLYGDDDNEFGNSSEIEKCQACDHDVREGRCEVCRSGPFENSSEIEIGDRVTTPNGRSGKVINITSKGTFIVEPLNGGASSEYTETELKLTGIKNSAVACTCGHQKNRHESLSSKACEQCDCKGYDGSGTGPKYNANLSFICEDCSATFSGERGQYLAEKHMADEDHNVVRDVRRNAVSKCACEHLLREHGDTGACDLCECTAYSDSERKNSDPGQCAPRNHRFPKSMEGGDGNCTKCGKRWRNLDVRCAKCGEAAPGTVDGVPTCDTHASLNNSVGYCQGCGAEDKPTTPFQDPNNKKLRGAVRHLCASCAPGFERDGWSRELANAGDQDLKVGDWIKISGGNKAKILKDNGDMFSVEYTPNTSGDKKYADPDGKIRMGVAKKYAERANSSPEDYAHKKWDESPRADRNDYLVRAGLYVAGEDLAESAWQKLPTGVKVKLAVKMDDGYQERRQGLDNRGVPDDCELCGGGNTPDTGPLVPMKDVDNNVWYVCRECAKDPNQQLHNRENAKGECYSCGKNSELKEVREPDGRRRKICSACARSLGFENSSTYECGQCDFSTGDNAVACRHEDSTGHTIYPRPTCGSGRVVGVLGGPCLLPHAHDGDCAEAPEAPVEPPVMPTPEGGAPEGGAPAPAAENEEYPHDIFQNSKGVARGASKYGSSK